MSDSVRVAAPKSYINYLNSIDSMPPLVRGWGLADHDDIVSFGRRQMVYYIDILIPALINASGRKALRDLLSEMDALENEK